ncbi:hypothetical protein NEF87_004233 [Candidatus Lokiarchaeum ossiferum]|uniref:Uncharacterized protein n=1 Tax=Candidatus Lokiarchaeum ossiferum TaxID=2951803 RepID=A0ABY6HWP7_9ARCH|nr:hypothetical protein NEF87_004233 [Candidatus Lokiarchaeum sp. B-35]
MQFQQKYVRVLGAVLFALFFSLFGVFIFSDFIYRGISIGGDIVPLLQSGSFNTFFQGLYMLFGSGFQADWFGEFSQNNIQESSLGFILFGETIWPAILTWFTVGILSGTIIKGVKRGLIFSLIWFASIFIIWAIIGMFAGADFSSMFIRNLGNTMGSLFTIFIFLIFGGVLGGLISGPANFD